MATAARAYWIVLGAFLVGSGLLAWSVLRQPYPQADWIDVESPRVATADGPLVLRVTLPTSTNVGWIIARLNWVDHQLHWGGFLEQTPPQPLTTNGGTFLLHFHVQSQSNLASVNALIYLSPTPDRSRQSRYVQTASLPVRASGTDPDPHWRRLHAFEPVPDPAITPREKPWARWLTSGLWLAALGQARRRGWRTTGNSKRTFHVLTGLCLVCALLELTGAEVAAAGLLRSYALSHDLYQQRHLYQRPAILAGLCVVGAAVAGIFRIRADPVRVTVLTAVALTVLFSMTTVFSLHATDRILAWEAGPLPLVQWMKLLAASGALGVLAVPGRLRATRT